MKPKCRVCGRALKNPTSVRMSIGPVCLMRERGQLRKRVFEDPVYPRLLDVPKIEKSKDDENAEQSRD